MEKGIDLGIKVIRNPLGQRVPRSGGPVGTMRGTSCVPRREVNKWLEAFIYKGFSASGAPDF
jgi:hypothetical protein